jgi:hypothetical protein
MIISRNCISFMSKGVLGRRAADHFEDDPPGSSVLFEPANLAAGRAL